ncbi:hypothetical protein T06_13619 [Trichinella sp. T6]|nr:hypothetical protein T06_13619 [Trichinella sp. T6]
MMSCKSYGVTAIDVHEVARLTIYACETIHICVAAHAIWCGSYVFGGSEWPSGPSRKLSTLDIAKSYLLQRAYILTSLDQRTELTNERN